MPTPRVNILERLERTFTSLNENECWVPTLKPTTPEGYRTLSYRDQPAIRAHRLAWEAHNAEPIPEGMVVMHTCDNPGCCNPFHLTIGSHKDNVQDCIRKGRRAKTTSKLTWDIEHARELRAQGLTFKAIAEIVGSCPQNVHRALKKAG